MLGWWESNPLCIAAEPYEGPPIPSPVTSQCMSNPKLFLNLGYIFLNLGKKVLVFLVKYFHGLFYSY